MFPGGVDRVYMRIEQGRGMELTQRSAESITSFLRELKFPGVDKVSTVGARMCTWKGGDKTAADERTFVTQTQVGSAYTFQYITFSPKSFTTHSMQISMEDLMNSGLPYTRINAFSLLNGMPGGVSSDEYMVDNAGLSIEQFLERLKAVPDSVGLSLMRVEDHFCKAKDAKVVRIDFQ